LFLFAAWSDESRPDRTTIDNLGATKAVSTAAAASVPAAAATKKSESPSPISSVAEPPSPAPKSPSIIQMLEGRESDVIIWLAIALAAFIMVGFAVELTTCVETALAAENCVFNPSKTVG
jgi:hypothetical protein